MTASNPNPQTRCHICGATASGVRDDEGYLCATHAAIPTRPYPTPYEAAGMVAGNVRGVDRDGKRGDGAESWEYREPQEAHDLHHDQEIIVGERLYFQQSPPVHVGGSAPKPHGTRRTASAAARAEARHDVDALLPKLTASLTENEREVWRLRRRVGLRRKEIAKRLGMTETAVKKALERAEAKVRKEVPQW